MSINEVWPVCKVQDNHLLFKISSDLCGVKSNRFISVLKQILKYCAIAIGVILLLFSIASYVIFERIAFDGKIVIKHDTIPGITIAVVDKNGCSLMDQRVYGKTSKLRTGKLNVTKTLLGPVINFANAVVGNDCKPVYKGKVKHPAKN